MDRAEKGAFITAVLFLSFFFALIVYAAKGLNIDVPTCITDVKPYTQGQVIQHAPNRYEIHYLAKMWYFEPADVELPVGSTVDIYLTSGDVIHGFQIDGTNVNLMAVPGAISYARVKFEKPGVYHIVCHEYCGIGHQDMTTRIVVKGGEQK